MRYIWTRLNTNLTNEFRVNVLIDICELECHIDYLIEDDEFTIEFVRMSDDEFEKLPEFEG